MADLSNKTAFVTAAGQGIGRAVATAYAAAGASVIATDINAAALTELAAAHPAIETAVLDVTDAAAITAMVDRVGARDIIFNCAGYVHNGTILECDEDDWARSFAINVTPMYRIIRGFLPAMLANGGGSIINVSSVAGSISGVPNRFVYGVTKAGVIGLTKSIAADYVAQGIRCNAICPGTIATPSLDERIDAFADPVAARRSFIERQPMGRLGKPAEIAALAVYLAGDDAAFTTGVAHVIDGGFTL